MALLPHDMIVNVHCPLALETKVLRMIRGLNLEPTNAAVTRMMTMLRDAFEGVYGRSNLTDWRIVTEWNDRVAYAALHALVQRKIQFRHRIAGHQVPQGLVARFN